MPADKNQLRLFTTLIDAGLPVLAVVGRSPNFVVRLDPAATAAQRNQTDSLVAAFDPSDAALATWQLQQDRAEAKAEIASSTDPRSKALRAAEMALFTSLDECRTKVNELVNAVNLSAGTSITLLPNRTWAQILSVAAARIDAGAAD
jgi:hypothetical protein